MNPRINSVNSMCTMNEIRIMPIFVLCVSLGEKALQQQEMCHSSNSMLYPVQWPNTSTKTLSKPPCVGKSKEFLYRECSNGLWSFEPHCDYVQQDPMPECPSGFKADKDFCYILTAKSTFPPECPYEDVVPFHSYEYFISKTNMGPVWMPVRRNVSSGLGFLQWIERSSLYKTTFDDIYFVYGSVKGKDCILYYNSSYKVAVSCDEEHSMVCAYKKLQYLDNQLCDSENECRRSDFSTAAKCICLGSTEDEEQSKYHKAEFIEPYQNQIIIQQALTTQNCTFGLEKTANGTYIWTNSTTEIGYTYWAPDVVFDDSHTYGLFSTNGWVLSNQSLECFFYQKNVEKGKPKLNLTQDISSNILTLVLTSPEKIKPFDFDVLVYCFTDASPWSLLWRYEKLTTAQKYIYNVVPATYGPGSYWCESFAYYDMQPIISETIFFRESDESLEFVMILRVGYVQGTNPLGPEMLMFLQSVLGLTFNSTNFNYTARIMKILDVDEEMKQILVNIHLSSGMGPRLDHNEEYYFLRKRIPELFGGLTATNLEMVNFLSSDFCLAESNKLTWENGRQGTSTTPAEYCFEANGDRFNRLCSGNFYDGAWWEPERTCEIVHGSNITQELERISTNENAGVEILNITQNHQDLSPLDIYLIGLIYERLSRCDINPEEFMEVVDNILQMNKSVLAESQQKMRATDKFLYVLDNLETNSSTKGNIVSLAAADVGGVVVQRSEDQLELEVLPPNCSLSEIISMENVVLAFWLSPNLQQQLIGTQIQFTVFKDNSFFSEALHFNDQQIMVGKVSIRIEQNQQVTVLRRIYAQDKTEQDCAVWNYDLLNRGAWSRVAKSKEQSLFLLCDFDINKYFAFLDSDVTEDLSKVLKTNTSAWETLQALSKISERYEEFEAVDVHLAGRILKKMTGEHIDLRALAQVVNNFHKIDRSVLLESQLNKGSTDLILHSVDTMVKNQMNQSFVHVTEDNFTILLFDLEETDVIGLALLNDNQIQIFKNDSNVESLVSSDDFQCGLFLSSQLTRQAKTDTNVAIIIYPNDALFNEEDPEGTSVAKIFDVIFPDVGPYSGPLTTLHKLAPNNIREGCNYWAYDSEEVKGSWAEDSEGQNISNVIKCEFWHTTHFALLLMDSEKFGDKYNLLDTITTINCILSLTSLGCILLTAIVFRKWRRNAGNQILLNFSFSIILQILAFYVSNTINQQSDDYVLCTVVGVFLHYSVLAEFTWMLIIAILQFKRFVEVFGTPPKKILLKCCLGGWAVPFVPVLYTVLFDGDNYIRGRVGLCYPSGFGLYLGVWFPIALIILINIILFSYIIYSVVHKKANTSTNIGKHETVLQWRLGVLLFFMLGLTWVFGFLAELDFGEVFLYIFCITATLQGFVVFLFFIVFNVSTRHLYSRAIKRCFNKI